MQDEAVNSKMCEEDFTFILKPSVQYRPEFVFEWKYVGS